MDKNTIGLCAGIVWQTLDKYRRMDFQSLQKATGLAVHEIYTAIGWLARENKIEFETNPNTNSVQYYLIEYYF